MLYIFFDEAEDHRRIFPAKPFLAVFGLSVFPPRKTRRPRTTLYTVPGWRYFPHLHKKRRALTGPPLCG